MLLLHLRRAVTVSELLEVRAIERAPMAEALDALRCAVMLILPTGATLGIAGMTVKKHLEHVF